MVGRGMQARFSTRTVLVGLVLLNIVAIGLSEVQRRSLIYRAEDLMIGLDRSRNSEAALQVDRLRKTVNDLNKQVGDVNWSVASLRIIANSSPTIDKQKLETQIADRLNGGKDVVVLFDDDVREDRDKDGRIRCGADTDKGYLGAFIAGERYTLRYDRASHQWTATGPAQVFQFDPATGICRSNTATYGPKELKAEVAPGKTLVLWGALFQVDGLDVMQSGRKVGSIAWFD